MFEKQFNVALTKADYVSGLSAITGELMRRDPFRDRRIWEQIGAGALLFLVLMFVFRDAGWAIFVTLIAESFVVSGLGERWMRKSFGVSYDPATAHFTVEFNEHGIAEQNPDRTRDWKWAAVRQVHDTGTEVVFELEGWDMLILPNRLWPDTQSKMAFVRQARELVLPRPDIAKPAATAREFSPIVRDQLQIGAIAVGVDTLFASTFLVPDTGGPARTAAVITALLIGAAAAYFAYRLARHVLPQLYVAYPRLTLAGCQVLILAVPLYIAAAYLGWISY